MHKASWLCVTNIISTFHLATAGPHSTTLMPTTKTTSVMPATKTTSNNDNYNYTPLICGIVGGIGVLIILTVVIMILAYCYFCRGRTENCTQWISYKKFTNS